MTLRQPPAPLPRHQSGGSLMGGATDTHPNTVSPIEEETKSEMVIGAKSENKTLIASIDSLPVDIVLFDILTRLGAQDIYNAARFVSRKWYQMIRTHNFIHTHLRHPTCGLLIQNSPNYSITLMEMRQDGQIELSNFSYTSRHRYWSSCNGLILEWCFKDPYELVVINPVTKQHIVLPRVPDGTHQPIGLSAIAYAPSPMVYKVVRTSKHGNPKPRKHCAILTVGIDKSWRLVDTEHLSLTASEHFNISPLVTGGFVHWAVGSSFVLTLDLETETISQFPVPCFNNDDGANCFLYFSTVSYLSLLVVRGCFKWDVWEMKPETGEWTKLPEIDLEAQDCTFLQLCLAHDSSFKADDDVGCKLLPVGWLKYREVLVFIVLKVSEARIYGHNQSRLRIAYNVRTRDFYWCESEPSFHPYLVHRNSLVWLNGC